MRMNKNWIKIQLTIYSIILPLLTVGVEAEQFEIEDINQAQQLFWQLYPKGGWTLYCGEHFDRESKVSIETVYSMSWVSSFLSCNTVEQCRESNKQFRRIESDLHNLYPALSMIIQARKDDHYGLVAGEYREYFECDFEHDGKDHLVEPRTIARGNIARSIFYMHNRYDLPIRPDVLNMLLNWNMADPPSKDEIRRNSLIEQIQGTRNPYIDNPTVADELRPTMANSDSSVGEIGSPKM